MIVFVQFQLILEPKSSSKIYRRLRVPEPEKEQRADRKLKRLADARQREIKLVCHIEIFNYI